MKYMGPLLAGLLTLTIVLVVGIYSFLPAQPALDTPPATVDTPVQAPGARQTIAPQPVDMAQIESTMAQRQAIYQEQIGQLDQALQQRQTVYQTQIQELTGQMTTINQQLEEMAQQTQTLQAQIDQLETTRTERLAVYQTQLQQAQSQYTSRQTELQTQLQTVQSQLAEANAQLGR